MKISRRQFLTRSSLAGAITLTSGHILAQQRPKLVIPPLIEMGRGRPIRLDFRPAQTQFNAGQLVDIWGANGRYLAPTVRVKSGSFAKLNYVNNLPQAISINVQGLLASTEMIGSMQRKLASGESWSPVVAIQQAACTGWYHAETMLHSAYQIYRGLAGLWIIEDEKSRTPTLPRKYGVDDIPLILQDQLISKEGKQLLDTHASQFLGNRLFVNGQESPYLNVPRGWVRLRIVNASLSRQYDLRLDNGKPLWLIATGAGFLAEPLEQISISLSPSERAELLIDLSEGEKVSLISGQIRHFFYKIEQLFSDHNDLQNNVVLELRPEGLAPAFRPSVQLPPFDETDFHLSISNQRTFSIRPLDFLINKQRFDPKRIDFSAKKGTVERWHIHSHSAIGFTLQGATFIVETRSGESEPYSKLAWRDTVWIEKDEEITLLVRFQHLANEKLPFSFGVSDFMLRDRGCMGQFTVVE